MGKVLACVLRILRYTWYQWFFRYGKLRPTDILLESKHGEDLAANVFYLLKELDRRGEHRLWLVLDREVEERVKKWLETGGIRQPRVLHMGSMAYYRRLATCGYLITDTTFPPLFSKRKGQIYLNTWHGTPLKAMGQDDRREAWAMGNVQRNLLLADYLVFPNDYMEEKMSAAYHLGLLYNGEILRCGYPRNSILMDEALRREARRALQIEDKEVYAYMPTWRGTLEGTGIDDQMETIRELLDTLEDRLQPHQLVWVKLHPFVKDRIEYDAYRKVRPFPEEQEPYQLLGAADGLITDYSSVMFDYANTGRPIYLYVYDEECYTAGRGLYRKPSELGLPLGHTAEEMAALLEQPAAYGEEFRQMYCTYDEPGATARIVDRMLGASPVVTEKKGERVLFFAGELLKNGITTAAMGLLRESAGDGRDYYVTFVQPKLQKAPARLEMLPQHARILPMCSGIMSTMWDLVYQFLYYYFHLDMPWVRRGLDRMFLREKHRLFGNLEFDHVIQYEGYGRGITQLFRQFGGQRTIFVHNNMEEELRTKNNQDPLVLRRAYATYDHVAIVTEDLRESVLRLGARPDHVMVVHNLHDATGIRRRGAEDVCYDADTKATLSEEELKALLQSPVTRFVTVGRFSAEKGHARLIRAFEKIHVKHPETVLIIIGGYGELYETTCRQAAESSAASRIVILRSLKNPMPIVAACQLFILSSFYEGQGLTILEADALGVATMSTRVCGPTGFMERYGGYLVENSEEGLVSGMEAYLAGKVHPMAVDYEVYNAQAMAQFADLIKK